MGNEEWKIETFKKKLISVEFSSLIVLHLKAYLLSTLNEFSRYLLLNLRWKSLILSDSQRLTEKPIYGRTKMLVNKHFPK